jgi:hypothetical protein
MRFWINLVSEGVGSPHHFHGSLDRITEPFHALTHFGSEDAAQRRAAFMAHKQAKPLSSDLWIHEVVLSITNPMRIHDIGQHSVMALNDLLTYEVPRNQRITQNEREIIFKEGEIGLSRVMLKRGFDGFIYQNKHEDVGHDSLIILESSQVRLYNVYSISLHDVLYTRGLINLD